jgi:2,3-bisphosphoglycerate-dependent phosphoglycerate mutase
MTPRLRQNAYADPRVYKWEDLFTELGHGLAGPPIHLQIVRHAESLANKRGLVAGQSDVDLSFRGYVQALALGFRLKRRYDLVCVSALGRAYRTIQIAQSVRLRTPTKFQITVDARLNERDLGDLEGRPSRRIAAYADGDLTYAPRGGESYLELARRLLSFLLDLRREIQRPSRVVIATHVGPMRLLVGIIEGFHDPRSVLALHFANAATYSGVLGSLRWPAFIRQEELFERHRTEVGATAGTPYDP